MACAIDWDDWIHAACLVNNQAFLKTLAGRMPELMPAIQREYQKQRGKKMIPPHEVIDLPDKRRMYRRREVGGNVRTLAVWTLDGCRKKIKDKQADGTLQDWFNSVTAQYASYATEQADPMLREWFSECYAVACYAYDELVAPAATIEELGAVDELEEFGA